MPQVITKDDAQSAVDPAEQAKAAQVAAEAAFASVDEPEAKQAKPEPKVKQEKIEKPEKSEAEKASDTKAKKEAADKAALDAEWEGVPTKVRQALEAISGKVSAIDKLQHDFKSIAGRTGAALEGVHALKIAMEAAQAAVKKSGVEAPTQAQITAATSSGEKWKQMKEDFPDWAEAMEERLAAQAATVSPSVDIEALRKEMQQTAQAQASGAIDLAEERAFVRFKYPNWKQTVKTAEFSTWLPLQAPEVQALAQSDLADDAIKLLDSFSVSEKAAAEKAAAEAKNKRRLESAITPKCVAAQANRLPSEREQMEQAFAAVDDT